MRERQLKVWQEQVTEKALSPHTIDDVLVVAESGAGKTALLDHIEDKRPVSRASFRMGDDVWDVYDTVYPILLDECGMMSSPGKFAEMLEKNPDLQTIAVTLPDCPPIEMIAPRFDKVIRVARD